MSISDVLGVEREIDVSRVRIRYREIGTGPTVVFVHGLLANGDVWRKIAPAVAAQGFRCITPDWPLGSHSIAVPQMELTPPTVAQLIVDFLGELELDDVTIVANDTGGALTQLIMVDHGDRLRRVVLVACDAFDHFLPPPFHLLPRFFAVPSAAWLAAQLLAVPLLQRTPLGLRWIAKYPMPKDIVESYVRPIRVDSAVRHDYRRFTRSIDKRYTLEAASRLSNFDKPVLLVWGSEGRLFPVALAERLLTILPHSELHTIPDCYVFVSEDRPRELTDTVLEFLHSK